MPLLIVACQAVIVVVFTLSAVSKLRSVARFRGFRHSVAELGGMSARRAATAAPVLVAAEVAAAALTAVPASAPVGFATAAALLTAFTAAIARAVRRRAAVACHCFGVSTAPLGRVHLVRNGILLAIAVAAGVAATLAGPSASAAPAALAAAVGVTVALVLVAADDLAALFRPMPVEASHHHPEEQ